jgi:hypothetical protein
MFSKIFNLLIYIILLSARRSVFAIAVRPRAESPVIISTGQRPVDTECLPTPKPRKGRNPVVRFDSALSGLDKQDASNSQGVALR